MNTAFAYMRHMGAHTGNKVTTPVISGRRGICGIVNRG